MLTRLIYASRASENVGIGEVRAIIEAAARYNPADGITGILCFDRIHFFQCLEGQRIAVNRVYNKIISDPRHKDVTLLEFHEQDRRLFNSWSMAYLSAQDDDIKSLIKAYSQDHRFDPYQLNARQASSLVLDFSRALTKETDIKILGS